MKNKNKIRFVNIVNFMSLALVGRKLCEYEEPKVFTLRFDGGDKPKVTGYGKATVYETK